MFRSVFLVSSALFLSALGCKAEVAADRLWLAVLQQQPSSSSSSSYSGSSSAAAAAAAEPAS